MRQTIPIGLLVALLACMIAACSRPALAERICSHLDQDRAACARCCEDHLQRDTKIGWLMRNQCVCIDDLSEAKKLELGERKAKRN